MMANTGPIPVAEACLVARITGSVAATPAAALITLRLSMVVLLGLQNCARDCSISRSFQKLAGCLLSVDARRRNCRVRNCSKAVGRQYSLVGVGLQPVHRFVAAHEDVWVTFG